jgi:hypothetical protein
MKAVRGTGWLILIGLGDLVFLVVRSAWAAAWCWLVPGC